MREQIDVVEEERFPDAIKYECQGGRVWFDDAGGGSFTTTATVPETVQCGIFGFTGGLRRAL